MATAYKPLIWSGLLYCFVAAASAQFNQQGPKLVSSDAIGAAVQGVSAAVSSDGNTALVGGSGDNNGMGAAWVFTRAGGVWTQQGSKLVGTGAIGTATQGSSVALSADGNTALVGGPLDNSNTGFGNGAAWVFTRSAGEWSQQGSKLVGTDSIGSYEGASVALSGDGNTAVVGGYGAAWVFTRAGGVWSQQGGKLSSFGGIGTAQTASVALSADGNTALVANRGDDGDTGATWVFTRSGSVWSQEGGKLVGSGAVGPASQGTSVALSADGNTALVGAPDDNAGVGATWVFMRSGGVWSQQGGKVIASDAIGGARQGSSVALSADGNTALIGGPSDNTQPFPAAVGAAWVFTRLGGVWKQAGKKLVGSGSAFAFQGSSAALSADGSTALVGGPGDNPICNFPPPSLHCVVTGYVGATWAFVTTPTTVGVAPSVNPSSFGQAIIFTATVTPGATGSITFIIDGVDQPPVALLGNQAQITVSSLAVGNHSISAAYSGDSTYLGSTSSVLIQTVNPPPSPVTLTFTSSANPSALGQSVTFTASLAGGSGTTLSGTVQFFDGAVSLGSAPVAGGQASFITSALSLGSHAILAKYGVDAQASMGQVVNGMASKTTVSANPLSLLYGQAVMVTAQVGPPPPTGFAAPGGQVTFQDNGGPAGVAALTSGTATLMLTALSVGTHQITAIYGGDPVWSSSFGRVTVTVTLPAVRLTSMAADLSTSFAPDEAVTLFNVTVLNGDTLAAAFPLTTSLGGAMVTITDSAGVSRLAPLYGVLASKGQVNLVIPGDTALGPAALKVTGPGGLSVSAAINITRTAPGLFAGGQVVHDPESGQRYLVLYGTGIRHRTSDASVTATVIGVMVPAQSTAQGTYPGLDQVNLQLPGGLAGAGSAAVAITVEGQTANTVTVALQ